MKIFTIIKFKTAVKMIFENKFHRCEISVASKKQRQERDTEYNNDWFSPVHTDMCFYK